MKISAGCAIIVVVGDERRNAFEGGLVELRCFLSTPEPESVSGSKAQD
ncbi:MAG: hypothetical protein KAJ66_02400 [Candidatus Omnitrophica bacterium]|nr:hypothetical protein [Candidatus Omnitrophota bacterium]